MSDYTPSRRRDAEADVPSEVNGKSNYWLTSGSFSLLHRGVDFVLGFLGFMLLVRILSQEDFGVWVLLITIVGIVEMARQGFLQNGMIKFIVGKKDEERQVQSAGLLLNVVLTLLIMIALWLAAPLLERSLNADGLAYITRAYVAVLPVVIFHTQSLILMQAHFNFKSYFYAGISRSLPLFLVICYFFISSDSLDLSTLVWWYNGTFVLATITAVYQVRRYFYFNLSWVSKDWLLKEFHFGKFVFGTNLMAMLTNSLDKFLLGALLSPVQIALANAAGRVINMIDVPIRSIASISYPKASEASENEGAAAVGRIFEKTVGMMLSITLPFYVASFLLAEYIILIIAGADYLEATPFLRVVLTLAILRPFDRQYGVFLDAIGQPFLNMMMVIGTFIYTVLASYALIQIYGLMGAAYALVAAIALTVLIKFFVFRYFVPFSLWKPFAEAVYLYPKAFKMLRGKLKI
jgi:O-antigen/teichoic acid export membrane protein